MTERTDFTETVDLLRNAQAGNRSSMERLLERYQGVLLNRIRLMMGDAARRSAQSVDFMQGVFVEILEGLERFEMRDERAFLRWATQIARNNIRDELRRRREQALGSFASSLDLGRGRDAARPITPSQDAVQHEQVEHLVETLEALPADHQMVLEMRDFEGLSFAEIGRRMERSENAVQLLHTRAMLRLGGLLESAEDP